MTRAALYLVTALAIGLALLVAWLEGQIGPPPDRECAAHTSSGACA